MCLLWSISSGANNFKVSATEALCVKGKVEHGWTLYGLKEQRGAWSAKFRSKNKAASNGRNIEKNYKQHRKRIQSAKLKAKDKWKN